MDKSLGRVTIRLKQYEPGGWRIVTSKETFGFDQIAVCGGWIAVKGLVKISWRQVDGE